MMAFEGAVWVMLDLQFIIFDVEVIAPVVCIETFCVASCGRITPSLRSSGNIHP